ncbi:hypothetical protein, partial [Streptomyces sp. NPDC050804]|uniref:hypothetical protein n=1 Tax=Streptomyces sp. NPDC050804 TaxID=3154745 RepID=UPI003427755A
MTLPLMTSHLITLRLMPLRLMPLRLITLRVHALFGSAGSDGSAVPGGSAVSGGQSGAHRVYAVYAETRNRLGALQHRLRALPELQGAQDRNLSERQSGPP